MNKLTQTPIISALALLLLLAAARAGAQWAASPGATVRNAFGPQVNHLTNQCRGACGGGCPDACDKTVFYECMDAPRLRRVVTYNCGTHAGCRTHDDCLDACLVKGGPSGDCQSQCDADAMDQYGADSLSWLAGGGPYDGRINFEYTRDTVDELEPAYHCPQGTSRQCGRNAGCATSAGDWVEPVFDTYPQAGGDAMRISDFRAGPACAGRVCTQSADIQITGSDRCDDGPCTRFGMEFDYVSADPSLPLMCTTSTSGGDSDFIGGLIKQGSDAMTTRSGEPDPDDGMGQLLGMFAKVVSSADSPEDLQVKITPLDENGNPIESQSVGSDLPGRARPIPSSIQLSAPSGHLFVPMYELASAAKPGLTKERRIRCTHRGQPVLETVVRLEHTATGEKTPAVQGASSANAGQGDCSCACSAKASADELCGFFCEEEFAACENR